MKRLLLLIALSTLFFACSSDDAVVIGKDPLIGQWYASYQAITYYWKGERKSDGDSFTKENSSLHWNFSGDGTMVRVAAESPISVLTSPIPPPLVLKATWTMIENVLMMEYENGDKETFTIKGLTPTKMIVFYEAERYNAPYEKTIVFTMVN